MGRHRMTDVLGADGLPLGDGLEVTITINETSTDATGYIVSIDEGNNVASVEVPDYGTVYQPATTIKTNP